MKKITLLTFFVFSLLSQYSKAQTTNCSLLNGTYIGTIAATGGTNFVTYPNFGPGYYFLTPVLNGGSYGISTCGASIDTQVTIWGGFNTNMLLYNDDNGPYCTGSNASGNFVANLTNYAYMFISEYPCLSGGSASINVYYRQNDNLSFTSSSAAMCSGESRTLTATPVNVGSVPNSTFGDPGTFSGVGVSGTVFTAPTVSATTNFTITYTFGYVSKKQVITVNPGAGLSVVATNSSVCNGYPVTLTASGATTYTWSGGITNGVAFTPTASAIYTVTSSDGAGCKNFRTYSVDVGDSPANQTFSIVQPSVCGSGTTSINLNNSEYGVLYTLVNAANNASLSAPLAGNGSSLTLNSNLVASTTTLGVQASISPTNGALAFDGVDDFITASNTVTATQGTWEAWVYKNTWSAHNDDVLFGNGIPFGTSNSFYISLHPTVGLHFRYGGTGDAGNNYASHILTQNFPAATWHHLAATWEKSAGTTTLSIYVDGYLMNSSTSTANITLGSPVFMGGNGGTQTYFGPGKMDEVKVWNVARTPSQIAADMSNYTPGAIPNLAYYWNMEDGTGSSSAQNIAGSVNSATLTNMNTSASWTTRPRVGCTVNLPQTVTFTVNPSPTVTVNSGSICPSNSFTIIPSGASTYTIQGGSALVSPSSSTTYTILGTSTAGCVSANTATSNVTVNPLPVISVASTTICAGATGSLTASGANTYTWNTGATTAVLSASPLSNTTYTVNGTSSAGCIGTPTTAIITVGAAPSIALSPVSVCAGSSATLFASGVTTYTWNTGANTASISVTPTINTTYTVTGNLTGCGVSATNTASVTVNSKPTVTANSGTICNGQTFTIIPSGAISYVYSSGSSTVSPTTTSNYTVTGTDVNGCKNTAVSSVAVNALPNVTVNSGAICTGSSFTMTPSGATSYTYSSGTSNVSPTANTNYTVTGVDANNCVNTAISSVTVNALPTVLVNSGAICNGATFTMTPSGAVTYTYSSGSNTVSPSVNTSYTVTGKDVNNCINTNVSLVTVNATPTVTVNSGAICYGQSFTITPSGADTYTISGGSSVVSPATTSSYSVTGTTTLGCVSSNVAVSSVTVNATPVVSVNSGAICYGQSFTITPSGASTYTISGGTSIVTPTSTSNYNVTGTSALGCVSTNTAVSTVTVNPLPTIVVNSGAICNGSSFTMTPSGAITYTYSSGASNVTPTTTTNYTVTGTDANGCNSDAVSTVTVNTLPSISVSSTTICAGATGSLTASGAATYTWNTGINTAVLSDNPTVNTSYTVNGTSSAGCVGTPTSAMITVGSAPSIALSSASVCAGLSATLTASGVSTYTWNTGANTASIVVTPTVNTTYTVNGNLVGCAVGATNIATVTVNGHPTVSATTSNSLICAGQPVNLTASGAVTYTWSTSATGSVVSVSPSSTTNYTVYGSDVNGCNNVATITQSVSTCTGINNSTYNITDFLVYPNPSNGILNIELEILNENTKIEITNSLGQIVLTEKLSIQHSSFNIHHFSNGIYFVKVMSGNTQTTKRLVINK